MPISQTVPDCERNIGRCITIQCVSIHASTGPASRETNKEKSGSPGSLGSERSPFL